VTLSFNCVPFGVRFCANPVLRIAGDVIPIISPASSPLPPLRLEKIQCKCGFVFSVAEEDHDFGLLTRPHNRLRWIISWQVRLTWPSKQGL